MSTNVKFLSGKINITYSISLTEAQTDLYYVPSDRNTALGIKSYAIKHDLIFEAQD